METCQKEWFQMEKKILIVEDNLDARDILAMMLKGEDYTVYTAKDGLEGLKLVELDCPDLIITDINMPNLDGIEMVRVLRERAECNKLPIIVMSAYGSRILTKAMEAGADQVVSKPLAFDWLLSAVGRFLE